MSRRDGVLQRASSRSARSRNSDLPPGRPREARQLGRRAKRASGAHSPPTARRSWARRGSGTRFAVAFAVALVAALVGASRRLVGACRGPRPDRAKRAARRRPLCGASGRGRRMPCCQALEISLQAHARLRGIAAAKLDHAARLADDDGRDAPARATCSARCAHPVAASACRRGSALSLTSAEAVEQRRSEAAVSALGVLAFRAASARPVGQPQRLVDAVAGRWLEAQLLLGSSATGQSRQGLARSSRTCLSIGSASSAHEARPKRAGRQLAATGDASTGRGASGVPSSRARVGRRLLRLDQLVLQLPVLQRVEVEGLLVVAGRIVGLEVDAEPLAEEAPSPGP